MRYILLSPVVPHSDALEQEYFSNCRRCIRSGRQGLVAEIPVEGDFPEAPREQRDRLARFPSIFQSCRFLQKGYLILGLDGRPTTVNLALWAYEEQMGRCLREQHTEAAGLKVGLGLEGMGRQQEASDEGGLFSLELSSHGGTAFSRGKEAVRGEEVGSAGISGRKLASYVAPNTMFEFKLLEAVRRFKQSRLGGSGIDHKALADVLSSLGYLVSIHTPQCTCKSNNRRCLEVLSHTYLLCTGTEDYQCETEIVVEPRLKEQFEIAHTTEGYRRLLDDVPAEFVGSRAKLKVLVEAISAAMAEAFKAQDLPLPPWRRTAAAFSKWDLDVGASGRSPSHSPDLHKLASDNCLLRDLAGRHNQAEGQQRFGFPENKPLMEVTGSSSNRTFVLEDPLRKGGSAADRASCRMPAAKNSSSKPKVSLLARGLADMAMVQKAKRPLEGSTATPKIKRAPSWDFSGLPPITTVKRSGRVK